MAAEVFTFTESTELTRVAGDDRAINIAWKDNGGNLIDFSSGYTFTGKIGVPGSGNTDVATFANGDFTGAATSPNVIITLATTDIPTTTQPGLYSLTIVATVGGLDRVLRMPIRILPA
jgi:hypothetical protein